MLNLRWPKFSGLIISGFINEHEVIFFSAGTSPNFSHFPRQAEDMRFPLILCLSETEKHFYYQCDVENYKNVVLIIIC